MTDPTCSRADINGLSAKAMLYPAEIPNHVDNRAGTAAAPRPELIDVFLPKVE